MLRPGEGYAMKPPHHNPYTDSPNTQIPSEVAAKKPPVEIGTDSHPNGQSRFHELAG